MQIKCLLFTKQFFSPIKTTILDLPAGLTDSEIMKLAKAELFKDFRVEIEDIREIKGKKYNMQLPNTTAGQLPNKPALQPATTARKRRTSIFEHNGTRYKRADIMELHGLSPGQYNYLMNIKKYPVGDVIDKGLELYKRERAS